MPSGDLAARLLQRLYRRRRGHAQSALAAGKLVLSAVLLHRVRQVDHHLVNLIVERCGLRGLHHLADVVALPLDDRLGKVGHVVRVDAAVLAHIGALDGGKARVVVDVLLVSVDGVLRVLVVVHKPRAERAAVYLAVAVERERIEPVRVYAIAVFALSGHAVVRLCGGQQRAARHLCHVHAAAVLFGVVALVPVFNQRHLPVALRRQHKASFLFLRVLVLAHEALCLRVVFLHPCHGRVNRLEDCAPVLNVLVHRVGVDVLRVPDNHAGHALAAVRILVP